MISRCKFGAMPAITLSPTLPSAEWRPVAWHRQSLNSEITGTRWNKSLLQRCAHAKCRKLLGLRGPEKNSSRPQALVSISPLKSTCPPAQARKGHRRGRALTQNELLVSPRRTCHCMSSRGLHSKPHFSTVSRACLQRQHNTAASSST